MESKARARERAEIVSKLSNDEVAKQLTAMMSILMLVSGDMFDSPNEERREAGVKKVTDKIGLMVDDIRQGERIRLERERQAERGREVAAAVAFDDSVVFEKPPWEGTY